MASKKAKKISDIIEAGGGSMQIAVDLGLTQDAVNMWRIQGIPRKHWPELVKRYRLEPAEIYKIDEEIRSENKET